MFKNFKKSIQDRLDFLTKNSKALFHVEVDKDQFWEMYLDSFPEGANQIFRERREYDCSCCRSFVKNYGAVVGIIDGKIETIWDVKVEHPFDVVAKTLNVKIKSSVIVNKFVAKDSKLGTDYSREIINDKSHRWDHFYCELPNQFVDTSLKSVADIQGTVRQTKQVIQRSFSELNPSSVETVLDLINQKILYRGEENKAVLTKFSELQRGFVTTKNKDNYCWAIAVEHGRITAIRNTAIGTLLTDISDGIDVEVAVKKYESMVAPANYKRPKAIYTKAMKEKAAATVTELGLMDSLPRRYAKLEDISIQNVLWASGESKKVMSNHFDLLTQDEKVNPKKFANIEEIGIDQFISDVLPGAENLELLFENGHKNNLVSLIAPQNLKSKSLLKWDNGLSLTYSGDFADSIKESVKAQGGSVDGDARFSIMWAEGDPTDNSDLDAHCKGPNGIHIYYSSPRHSSSKGFLDVDIQTPNSKSNKNIVENISWPSKEKMPKGDYKFRVHNYSLRGSQKGFQAQLELDGQIFDFVYDKPLRHNEFVDVATVHFDGNKFTIKKSLKSEQSSKQIWGVSTMKFVPVSTVMLSPNHWGSNSSGNRHFLFMLQDCVNTGTPRGFFNEFLRNDLMEHKKVFEALGDKMRVAHTENQLSGLGFSSTKPKSITVKVNSKPLKINITDDKLILKSTTKKVSV